MAAAAPGSITIRAYRDGDAPALRRAFASSVRGIGMSYYRPEQVDAWAPAQYDAGGWRDYMARLHPFVAERDGSIAGYADLQDDGLIDHFYVDAAHARRGVGNALMRRIMDDARRRHIARLHAKVSLAAEEFFASHGFVVVERCAVRVREVEFAQARMQRVV